jgi:multiple sugar transport system permease protein
MKNMKEFIKDFKLNWPRYKSRLFGSGGRKGVLYYIAVYFLSITFAFIFIYPIFYMFMISLMSNTDLVDSTVLWIPSKIYWNNYRFSITGLNLDTIYLTTVKNLLFNKENLVSPVSVERTKLIVFILLPWLISYFAGMYTKQRGKIMGISTLAITVLLFLPTSYVNSLYVAGTQTLIAVLSSAFIGYGLARFQFRGKAVVFVLMLLIYILPTTLLFIPRLQLYGSLGIKGSMFALWIPTFFGQGLQATFFILIFFQFFKMIPGQIEESAYLDGANSLQIFFKIALPMAVPAFIIAATYGFAVNWNEMFMTNLYLEGNIKTIPMLLQSLQSNWDRIATYEVSGDAVDVSFSEAKSFAGTILSVIPLMIMYGVAQRFFIESIDKSGIAGE